MKAEEEAVGFVTKRALVTFARAVCLPINGTPVYAGAAICEMQQQTGNQAYPETPRRFRIIALPDGRKITKSYNLTVGGFGEVSAVVDLDDEDVKALVG